MKIRIVRTPAKHLRFFAVCLVAAAGIALLAVALHFTSDRLEHALEVESSGPGYDKTVVIDPGHGGMDGGAVGVGGVVEKGINLAISLRLKSFFEATGYKVIMTRTDDRSIHDEGSETIRQKKVTDIHNRSKLLAENPRAIFISVHQNKFGKSQLSGTQVFYSKNNDDSKLLAQFLQSNVKELLQPANEREIKSAGKNLYILYHAKSPAVMVECGFLSNPGEAALLQDSSYQGKMAFAIFCGTLDFYSGE